MKFQWLFRRKSGERKLELKGGQGKMGANLSYRKRLMDPSPLRALQNQQRVTPLASEDGEGSSRGRSTRGEGSSRGGSRGGGEGSSRASVDSIVRVGSDTSDETTSEDGGEDLSVSFGYHCRDDTALMEEEEEDVAPLATMMTTTTTTAPATTTTAAGDHLSVGVPAAAAASIFSPEHLLMSPPCATKPFSKKSRSFSCLTGAALSANATLANTTICNGLIGEEILPGLDSPRTFRKLNSSASTTMLELSRGSSNATHQSASFPPAFPAEYGSDHCQEMDNPSFLEAGDVQMAGGAAGEDRVQAVCSEENGWLYCGIYDGFNGRDAADYLAGTFYENVGLHMKLVEWHVQRESVRELRSPYILETPHLEGGIRDPIITDDCMDLQLAGEPDFTMYDENEVQQQAMMRGLMRAFNQTEGDFLSMVEQEMDERPELAMVGSCVLSVLIHGKNLYTLNLGDSRAVLATYSPQKFNKGRCDGDLYAVQLTESHVVDNVDEKQRILAEHPDDHTAISGGRLKGKLKVTRAFGAGYLKKAKLNDGLMGILRVKDLYTPPYLGTVPCVSAHAVTCDDVFVVLGSDGLFDFFTNEEVVNLVHHYILDYPHGDPAKYMLEQLLNRAALNADITVEQLKTIPIGRRRKYHDDVTVIIIVLGTEFRTSSASTES
ncbi:pyruvate dehydrogenase phosphatase [Marchantia polymorpha subsp. ruderalis]|uniref:protein-serine/threonine phosphatase n=2 Tax=Marchantia polymorpha TaxID=3197 RepID=A0A176VEK4_MARPO|nr:hypothetical protein AXG93_313s1190 [Marchantia polymorpha subsp. ruderalis]PTQ32656.1 hypothetical protein MARPO_0096s0013 [Marchantia polymorpha]PTQ32657.1 hypothetical protein MARPO_0096s0013 [Marchantia polymorpha]BBM97973.1 hypothetical protein Mp_1g09880 [Marchantia polymorpha subsp. ruderalis]BBM97974.1 hypothetical protein Mp_1g09880 [Marchantia polymorpha subsp. ruderalis]|eukprot:PTQ32656.1 hypothetical protein MARPO_0096s0013 [Marchantia polymorpha]